MLIRGTRIGGRGRRAGVGGGSLARRIVAVSVLISAVIAAAFVLFLLAIEGLRDLSAAGAPATFAGYLSALKERRAYFIARGAVR